MRLLVTRPQPEANALADELRQLGHDPVLQPLIEFHSLRFDPEILGTATGLIITSGNGIRALQESADARVYLRLPLFCVGEETARRARAAGFGSIAAVAETAQDLASGIPLSVEPDSRLVHVSAADRSFDLEAALSPAGLSPVTVLAYEMRARAALDPWLTGELERDKIAGVILMSARTAQIFVSLCRGHGLSDRVRGLHYFCISASVASKVKPLRVQFVHVAGKPNRKALLELLDKTA